ncbi:unnamed protein product [Echinostoma caproni]|uniref:cAMP-dependent protein kinase type II regulatory subunit n=1 Tax=Echinostoma caproni TaxID=27848 RepID=A0A183ATV3_9TREM|nr:unnamed protein product [Echinostoma caproni]
MSDELLELDLPPGYVELLQHFTISVLRSKPTNLINYAIDYFTNLRDEAEAVEHFFPTGHNPPILLLKSKSNREDEEKNKLESKEMSTTVSHSPRFDRHQNENLKDHNQDEQEEEEEEPIASIQSGPPRFRRASIAAEPYNPDDAGDNDEEEEEQEIEEVDKKTPEQYGRLVEVCKKIMLFRNMEEEQLEKVIHTMTEQRFQPGDKIIVQGEEGNNFYVIDSGIYEVFIRDANGQDKSVFEYQNEGYFGELALMYNAPRSATVVAKTTGRVWSMERKHFRKFIMSHAVRQRRAFIQLLHSVQMLQELSPYERMNLADALIKRSYQDGECIIREGEPGREMYFIMQGRVRVERKATDGLHTAMGELGKGQYFGELALLSDQPRAASVFALGKVILAVLGVESFERLLGPCVAIMRRNTTLYGNPSN